uniref:UDP-N-acetylglucosamine transferase subunit ALG13 n=1 Tax=Ditylenchus dipsaci TaxID=166011 RepID=A0A915EPD9_9BILA
MHCFVTVGSTKFEGLVESVLSNEVLSALQHLQFKELFIQCGSGEIPEGFKKVGKQGDGDAEQSWCDVRCGIEIHIFHYKRNISAEMRRADLIIGHAGAGTTLESLELGKPLVVVINEALADNHQLELAERLAHDRHLLFTVPKKLADTLEDINLFKLESFPKADPLVFANFLNGQLSLKFD